jgi:uncharacterized protein YbjT (DUF2867 family)
MVIGVLGGTGQVGSELVDELSRRGHGPIALCRTAQHGGTARCVDVVSGEGLADAVAGLDALVDVLQGGRRVLVDGVRRALAAAREAGVAHVVSLSIVGCDRVPLGYYRVKVEQEAAVREGGVPWSIVRATQFHSLVAETLANAARRGVLPLLRVPLQPLDHRELAPVLADLVEAGPSGATSEFAGPRVERVDELARAWARAQGVRRLPLPIPALGPVLRAVRAGGLTSESAPRGRVTFGEWLEEAA